MIVTILKREVFSPSTLLSLHLKITSRWCYSLPDVRAQSNHNPPSTHPAASGRWCSSWKVLLWSCNSLADSLTCSWQVQSFPLQHSPQASLAVSSPATSPWSTEDAQSLLCVPEQPAIIETAGRQRTETYMVIMAFFECDLLTDMCSVNCMWFIISCIPPVHHNYSVIIASFVQNKTPLIMAQQEPLEHSQLYAGA